MFGCEYLPIHLLLLLRVVLLTPVTENSRAGDSAAQGPGRPDKDSAVCCQVRESGAAGGYQRAEFVDVDVDLLY